MNCNVNRIFAFTLSLLASPAALCWDLSGYTGVEDLGFFDAAQDPRQHNNYVSGVIEPNLYHKWDNDKQSFTFVPFFRYSQYDNHRTHFDIRELTWLKAAQTWEMRVGFRKVFWGVTEGEHLVDIINQSDLVENVDGEDKLGQPMVNLALIHDWGTVDLFLLTGFRERTFPGVQGRLRTFPQVDTGNSQFAKQGAERQVAFAARWSKSLGDWDIGLAHFHGTARQPTFAPVCAGVCKADLSNITQISPFYDYIDQTSLDVQATKGSWLWKLESITRSGQGPTFIAATGGVEYTFSNLASTGVDLGLIAEYMYDSRGYGNYRALTQQVIYQDDFMAGLRFGFNDTQNTQLLTGVIFDRTHNSKFYSVEASRRLWNDWTVDVEARFFSGIPPTDFAYIFRTENHIRTQVSYHF